MRSLILLILCLFSFAAYSEVIVVDKNLPFSSIGKSISYLQDAEARLSISQILQADRQGLFISSDVEILNFGNSRAAYWLKVSFINKTNSELFLVLGSPGIENVDLFVPKTDGGYHRIHTGSLAASNPEVLNANNYIFSLKRSDLNDQIQTVYLRLRTNNILLVPLKLAVADGLLIGMTPIERFESIYIGILIALFFFNFSVFINSRDYTYLYYSLYILAFFFYVVFYFRGYSYIFGNDFRIFLNTSPHLFLGLGMISGIAFSRSFLNLKETLPWAVQILRVLAACWMTTIVLSVLGFKSLTSDIAQILSSITTISVWVLGILAYRTGYKPAVYFIIAWSFVCLTSVWVVLSLADFFPYNELSVQIAPLGFVFELLLLSLALGDRLKDMKYASHEIQERQLKFQQENLYLVNSQNERLEKVVESRTRALKKMIQSLENANADKNRIFSIIAHDLRSPFNSLISLFSLNDMDMLTFEDVKILLNDSRRNIDNIHNTLNNLLYWAQSQMQGITTAPSRFNMRVMVEDLMLVYQPLTAKKSIMTEIIIEDDNDVFADLNQINVVIRNLIDNAIKFTPLGLFIRIKIWGDSNHVYVDISNPVADPHKIDKFTHLNGVEPSYGTANERGVGLGLHLCRDFVERNNGALMVTIEGDCVVMRFNVPKYLVESSPIVAAEVMEY